MKKLANAMTKAKMIEKAKVIKVAIIIPFDLLRKKRSMFKLGLLEVVYHILSYQFW